MDTTRQQGRVALITGAAGGMGRAIALALAERGTSLVLNDTSTQALEPLISELGSRGVGVVGSATDVTDPEAVASMVDVAVDRLGAIDILVNNAGVLRPTRFTDITPEEWAFVVGVNLTGSFLCSRAVVPAMRAAGWGRIVNLSSTAGKNVSTMGGAHYTAAKAGVLGLTRAVAAEVAADGITVNAVCPGLIDTDMTRNTITVEQQEAYARSFPIPRLGAPEEVASLVAFLASDDAAYITGASLDINGGDLMI